MNPYTKIRQNWLLEYFWKKHPQGIADVHVVPCEAPAGIGMVNIRGLQRRGLVQEPAPGVFYLTEQGVQACQELFGAK